MTDITLQITGVENAVRGLERELRRLGTAEVGAHLEAAQVVYRHADTLVPIDTGNLAANSGARIARDDPKAAEVYYDADYAAPVHEAEDVQFQRPGARAMWLKVALVEKTREIIEIIARRIDRAAGG